jgi:DNA-binding NarL/FixJ family response regulator
MKSKEEILKASQMGVAAFIMKPYKLDVIKQKISKIPIEDEKPTEPPKGDLPPDEALKAIEDKISKNLADNNSPNTNSPNTEADMILSQIKAKAKSLGIDPGKLGKRELIQAIQRAENNPVCYGSHRGDCTQSACCWLKDCLQEAAG